MHFGKILRTYWVHIALGCFTLVLYVLLLSKSIVGGDSGDLAAAAYLFGVPHPPGYPLYTFLASILSHVLPVYTVAFRIGLLSSLFASLSIVIFYSICVFLTRNRSVSFITSLSFAFVYPFWLYAEVVEVFSLAVFLLLCILFLSLFLRDHFSSKKFYALLFFLGLSVTHHHTILFLFPSIFLLVRPQFRLIWKSLNVRFIFYSIFSFLLGLLPLVYLPIASLSYPAIDWERPATFFGFINLLFRVSYGTFQAGPSIVDNPFARIISLATFFELSFFDLGVIGIIFGLIGILVSRKSRYFAGLIIGLFFYIFFFFYASFPVVNAFSLATFERFAIFPYIFILFFVLYGFVFLQKKLKNKWVVLLFLIYPLTLFLNSLPEIYALRDRFSSEILGRDILDSAKDNSLILLVNDTPLFSTQYVYFAEQNTRFKTRIPIHFHKLYFPYYYETLKRNYPQIVLPKPKSEGDDLSYLSDFLDLNSEKTTLYTNFYLSDLSQNLIPSGLLFRYVPKSKAIPSLPSVIDENSSFWKRVDGINPLELYYENNFAAEILNVYSTSLQNYAHYLIDQKEWSEAETILKKARKLTPDDADIAFLEGLAFEYQRKCIQAEKKYFAVSLVHSDTTLVWGQLAQLSRECFKDEEKAKQYELKRQSYGDTSLPLEEL